MPLSQRRITESVSSSELVSSSPEASLDEPISEDDDDQSDSSSEENESVSSVDLDDKINEVREVVRDGLDGVSSNADQGWAFGAIITQAINPGLTLKSSGIVGLPLSTSDASRIAGEAKVGNADVLGDNGSRLSCDLSPDAFELRDPAWGPFVSNVAAGILGKSVKALQLKVVNLSLQSQTSDDRKPSTFSDVCQESGPVVSGHRLLLTYNVFLNTYGGEMETATSLSSYARDFEHELARWKSLRKTEGILVPEVLVYMMDDYSGQDGLLELSTLREEYRFKAEYLRERCAKVGVRPYLSKLRCIVDAYDSSKISMMELDTLVDFDDTIVFKGSANIREESLVRDDAYKWRDSNDPEYDEDPLEEVDEHHYLDWAFVLVPEDRRVKFILGNSDEAETRAWISNLLEEIQSKETEETKEELTYIAGIFTSVIQKPSEKSSLYSSYSGVLYGRKTTDPQVDYEQGLSLLVRASLLLQDSSLFAKVFAKDPNSVTPGTLSDILKALDSKGLKPCEEGLNRAASWFTTLHGRYEFLKNFLIEHEKGSFQESSRKELDDWVFNTIEETLTTLRTNSSLDAQVMLEMRLRYGDEFILDWISPAARMRSSDLEFACTLFKGLTQQVERGEIQATTAVAVARNVLPAVILDPGAQTVEPCAKRQKLYQEPESASTTNDGRRLASLVSFCAKFGLLSEAERLLDLVKQALPSSNPSWLRHTLIPVLIGCTSVIQEYNVSENLDIRSLFQQGISNFNDSYVGPKPDRPKDNTLPRRGCGCKDCGEHLDPFLRHPNSKRTEFTSTEARRGHLSQRLAPEPSVRTSTRRNPRAPHTLTMEKTTVGYEQAFKAWDCRRDEAKTLMMSMKDNILRELLADRYSELVGTQSDALEGASVGAHRSPLAVTQASAPVGQRSRTKAPVEIIDLVDG